MHYTPMELPETPSFLNKEAVFGALLTSLFVLAVGAIFINIFSGSVDQPITANLITVALIAFIGAIAMGGVTGAANGKSRMMVEYFHAKQTLSAFTTNAKREEKGTIEPVLEPEAMRSQSKSFTAMVEKQRNIEKTEELSL